MGNQAKLRTQKRVYAIPRAPDGSAFQKCNLCGVSVAIALTSMHDCGFKNKNKCKTQSGCGDFNWQNQPRSAFRFFVEDFMKTSEDENIVAIENKAFGVWKNMTNAERQPYVLWANKLNSAYVKLLRKEENEIEWVDEEVDSADIVKIMSVGRLVCTAFQKDLDSSVSKTYKNSAAELLFGACPFVTQKKNPE